MRRVDTPIDGSEWNVPLPIETGYPICGSSYRRCEQCIVRDQLFTHDNDYGCFPLKKWEPDTGDLPAMESGEVKMIEWIIQEASSGDIHLRVSFSNATFNNLRGFMVVGIHYLDKGRKYQHGWAAPRKMSDNRYHVQVNLGRVGRGAGIAIHLQDLTRTSEDDHMWAIHHALTDPDMVAAQNAIRWAGYAK